MEKILVVDDEQSMREVLALLLKKQGYEVSAASGCAEALKALKADSFDLVVTDLKLPDGVGLDVLSKAKEIDPDTQVIMITAFGSAETAVEAMKLGAYDYIGKPFKVDRIQVTVRKALEKCSLARENRDLRKKIEEARLSSVQGDLFGKSPKAREVLQMLERVSATTATVLVAGESGTGKEVAAQRIHSLSGRKGRFVPVNCSAIPEGLIESELFGHLKGSFTGATTDKPGLFEEASGGTLFLDEIGELPMSLQPKLLRALQEGKVKRVGSTREIDVDARIISATNRDLLEAVKEGRFREDLYYRLNVLSIELPPLRQRREDVPLLANHFFEKYRAQFKREIRAISPEFLAALEGYPFPGNIRELENIIERAVALETSDLLTVQGLPRQLVEAPAKAVQGADRLSADGMNLDEFMRATELSYINQALELTGGNKTKAAELLGMSFRSFRYRLEKLGLDN